MLDRILAEMLEGAEYDGFYEIPIIQSCDINPKSIQSIIPFSEIFRTTNYNQWICFYEKDESFERLWNNPYKYLKILKKFDGIITPDFSVYQDYQLNKQIRNISRQREIGYWLQKEGLNVIINYRWGDFRTIDIATCGIPKNSIIAIGTVGCFRGHNDTKDSLFKGLDYGIEKLQPRAIIVYGPFSDNLFCICRMYGIEKYHFNAFHWKDREALNGKR